MIGILKNIFSNNGRYTDEEIEEILANSEPPQVSDKFARAAGELHKEIQEYHKTKEQ